MSVSTGTQHMSHLCANPDDSQVRRASQGLHGPSLGPYSQGLPGRVAIVQGQLCLVAVVVVVQIWRLELPAKATSDTARVRPILRNGSRATSDCTLEEKRALRSWLMSIPALAWMSISAHARARAG